MEIESENQDSNSNSSKNLRSSIKKLSKTTKSRMMELLREEDNNNNELELKEKSSLSLLEDKKEEEENQIKKSNISLGPKNKESYDLILIININKYFIDNIILFISVNN